MDKHDAVNKVVAAITEVLEASGRTVTNIEPATCPFQDLEGFDSLSGVEATESLSSALGQDLPDSVFSCTGGDGTLSVSQVADNLMQAMSLGRQ